MNAGIFYRCSILLAVPFDDRHLVVHELKYSTVQYTRSRSSVMSLYTATVILLNVLVLIEGNLKDVLTSLGWRSILVAPINHQTQNISTDLAKQGTRVGLSGSFCNSYHDQSLDGTVTDMTTFDETLFQHTVQCGIKEPYRNLLLLSNNTLDKMRADDGYLAGIKKSVGLVGLLVPDMKLLRMLKISTSKQIVIMPFKATEFDLQDLKIVNYNLPFFPYISYNCKEERCDVSGYYPDLIHVIGEKFNFSVLYRQEPSGDWGTVAKVEKNASNVLQKVHSGKSALTFPWVCTFDRSVMFDFIPGGRWIRNMYMMENDVKVSIDMIFKPFTIEAWGLIIMFLSTITIAHKVLKYFDCSARNVAAMKSSMAFFSWLFVTVIIAFYRSAMVIAFTTETSVPFKTITEGLANEDWNLVYYKFDAEYIKNYFDLIPKSESRANKVLGQSYQYAANDALEAFQHLADSNTFLFYIHNRALNFLRNTNCDLCKNAIKFGEPVIEMDGFLLEKHSPIREVLKIGVAQAWERGIHETLMQSYLGPPYKPTPDHTSSSVTLQFMILILISLGTVALIMSPTILLFENMWRKLTSTSDHATSGRCDRIYEEGICPQCGCKQILQKLCIN